ncbi:HNH endonuclease [Bradyrhizobium sp. 193]|uniref:HNH endonuclease n=1 Tax=Bradyrhizobium sp. 193 TaxID=2782661 RepID=UPI001FF91BA7
MGEIVESPRLQIDPADVDADARPRAKIRFDRLVDPDHEFLVEFQAIRELVPEFLFATQSSGIGVPDSIAIELERLLGPFLRNTPPITGDQADDIAFDPDSVDDERERAIRAIRLRRGQPAFRAALLAAYEWRCAISGCSIVDVLEAAHITPYLGGLTHHVSNGLLLRADLHTLFDCGLLAIEPTTRTVVIADRLKTSSYAKLYGKRLRQPNIAANAPSRRNLEKRYALFEAIQ